MRPRRARRGTCRRPWHDRHFMKRLVQAPNAAIATLWADMLRQAEHARATALLHDLRHLPHLHWLCAGCGERVDGPFEQCWNCGAMRP